jgi:predicted aspartyl protease
MRGTVVADGNEALLTVEVLSQVGASSHRVEAVVDTGFSGHLTLPSTTVETLCLPIIESAESVLADGSLVMEDVCLSRVLWHGGDMALMRGSALRVECVGGGEVSVERLEEPSS